MTHIPFQQVMREAIVDYIRLFSKVIISQVSYSRHQQLNDNGQNYLPANDLWTVSHNKPWSEEHMLVTLLTKAY